MDHYQDYDAGDWSSGENGMEYATGDMSIHFGFYRSGAHISVYFF
jgi:hypothetical protein